MEFSICCDVSCFRGITVNSLFGVEKVREHV